jgi:hypothetical protein
MKESIKNLREIPVVPQSDREKLHEGLDEQEIPTIDLKMVTKEVKGGIVYTPWTIIETPYMIYSDANGTRKVWTGNKWKIALYYLYKVTRIEWFIKKYNKLPR